MTHTRTGHPLMAALRAERRRQKISQVNFAKRIGWAAHTVTNAENGTSSPSFAFVSDYADGLGVELRAFRVTGPGLVELPSGLPQRRTRCSGPCGRMFPVTGRGRIRKHPCAVTA